METTKKKKKKKLQLGNTFLEVNMPDVDNGGTRVCRTRHGMPSGESVHTQGLQEVS